MDLGTCCEFGAHGIGDSGVYSEFLVRVQGLGIRWFIQSLWFRVWDLGVSLELRV